LDHSQWCNPRAVPQQRAIHLLYFNPTLLCIIILRTPRMETEN